MSGSLCNDPNDTRAQGPHAPGSVPLSLYCQRSEVPLSVLPLGQDFKSSLSSSALVLPGLPTMGKATSAFHLCRDFQRCEYLLPQFCSALTTNDMKFSFRTSALLPQFGSVFTAKDLKFRFPYLHSAMTSKISFIFRTCSARTFKYG